ncbi:MAG: hypothetical protein ACLFN8_01510 [Candidatus Woesearchaeota archaeon]
MVYEYDVKISFLEDKIINLYSYIEAIGFKNTSFANNYSAAFDLIAEEKRYDYSRLVKIYEHKGYVPKRVKDKYWHSSPCGKLQVFAINLRPVLSKF